MSTRRVPPAPGQESVWDYPRPPRLEPNRRHLRVLLAGAVVAETRSGWRVLETSHPPVYYFPRGDVDARCLRPASGGSYCEWKGAATYFDVMVAREVRPKAAWSYLDPTVGFGPIRDHLAFFAGRVDECSVDGEPVVPQPGRFYGGWITPEVVGPFKGASGTSHW